MHCACCAPCIRVEQDLQRFEPRFAYELLDACVFECAPLPGEIGYDGVGKLLVYCDGQKWAQVVSASVGIANESFSVLCFALYHVCFPGSSPVFPGTDCAAIKTASANAASGTYWIQPVSSSPA